MARQMKNYYVEKTMNDIKNYILNYSDQFKAEIDSCRPGQIVSVPVQLPFRCIPERAEICFSSFNGMYSVMVNRPVIYAGTISELIELFDKGIMVFDDWKGLKEFFSRLPYMM